jgi:hypothetical protein
MGSTWRAQVLFVATHSLGGALAAAAPDLMQAAAGALRDAGRPAGERLAASRLLAALVGSGSEPVLAALLPHLLHAAEAVRRPSAGASLRF